MNRAVTLRDPCRFFNEAWEVHGRSATVTHSSAPGRHYYSVTAAFPPESVLSFAILCEAAALNHSWQLGRKPLSWASVTHHTASVCLNWHPPNLLPGNRKAQLNPEYPSRRVATSFLGPDEVWS